MPSPLCIITLASCLDFCCLLGPKLVMHRAASWLCLWESPLAVLGDPMPQNPGTGSPLCSHSILSSGSPCSDSKAATEFRAASCYFGESCCGGGTEFPSIGLHASPSPSPGAAQEAEASGEERKQGTPAEGGGGRTALPQTLGQPFRRGRGQGKGPSRLCFLCTEGRLTEKGLPWGQPLHPRWVPCGQMGSVSVALVPAKQGRDEALQPPRCRTVSLVVETK